ncbi:MAG TPA: PAS domain-containing protein [Vicinamibacterales bacterium]|nr:PAS domain-containing protein [Vicinamibacterales bacterium]
MPSASLSDIDRACQALSEIKRHLQRNAQAGSAAVPTAGVLLAAIDECPDAVIVANDAAEIKMVNGAAARLTGLSTRELQTLTIWDVTHSAAQVDFELLWKEYLRAGRQRGSYALRHRDGTPVEVAYCSEASLLPQCHLSVLRRIS